jgi:L-fuconate dehydratase
VGLTITDLTVRDIRFPTSRTLDGSAALNPGPDYSATYVVLHTAGGNGLEGHGLTFTVGRGNEVCVAAVKALKPLVVGHELDAIKADMAGFWRSVASDSQLRWLGPEKGALHLATAAVINALWDLYAKEQGKPLWKLLVNMTPEETVACIDFSHITDALTPDEALEILRAGGRRAREEQLRRTGFPAYTTSVGWLGYDDDKIRRLCREARNQGWTRFKLKVGENIEEDVRRMALVRGQIGPDCLLMADANQIWSIDEAIAAVRRLAPYDPWWIEEPTHPDDILGHARIAEAIHPIRVATGEHCPNRVMFKQFFQARAMDVCQLDVCRLGGINDALAVLLMARKFDIPVCPHGGGVGLCEYIQHLAIFDMIAISGQTEGRMLEYIDHLHEHFRTPVVIENGSYRLPRTPGASIEMHPASLARFAFPEGAAWAEEQDR